MARILVVDDEADILAVTKLILEMEGHEVVTAKDGLEAIAMVKWARPDLVITDVMMPGIDGLELCARLRRDSGNAALPVVLTSAVAEPPAEGAGLFNAFLRKPVPLATLLEIVARLLAVDR